MSVVFTPRARASRWKPLWPLALFLALAFVLYAASFPSVMETLTAGTITVVFSSMIALMRPLKSLTNVNAQFQRGMAACQTLFSILDSEQEKDEGTRVIERAKGNLEFNNVTFTYPGREVAALRNINLSIPEGKTVALVGRSGSGKSTIASLITRFYDVDEGEILVDGVNVRDYTFDTLYNKLGYVTQKAVLFAGSIRDNVYFGESEAPADDEGLAQAVELSQAKEFVDKLPDGTQHHVAQMGRNMSGGQKQRLSIARALARKPEILVFDDSFSALDYRTDAKLREGLSKQLHDTTKIIVAQRISTIRHADKIIVLDRGETVGIGTHEELMKNCDVYREIATSQLSAAELA